MVHPFRFAPSQTAGRCRRMTRRRVRRTGRRSCHHKPNRGTIIGNDASGRRDGRHLLDATILSNPSAASARDTEATPGLSAPSASARCAGCGHRPLPSCRCRGAGTRRSRRRRGAGAGRRGRSSACTTAMARAEDRAQFDGNCDVAMGRWSVWPSTRITQGMSGGTWRSSSTRAEAMRSISPGGLRAQHRLAGREEHLRLEHEAVADDAHVRAVAEDLPQAAEEVGAVAGEFLHPLGEGDVEAAAEIGDAGLAFPVPVLGRREGLFERRELAAHGGDLLVEDLDLARAPGRSPGARSRAAVFSSRAWA